VLDDAGVQQGVERAVANRRGQASRRRRPHGDRSRHHQRVLVQPANLLDRLLHCRPVALQRRAVSELDEV
jgi:hypothetical protein